MRAPYATILAEDPVVEPSAESFAIHFTDSHLFKCMMSVPRATELVERGGDAAVISAFREELDVSARIAEACSSKKFFWGWLPFVFPKERLERAHIHLPLRDIEQMDRGRCITIAFHAGVALETPPPGRPERTAVAEATRNVYLAVGYQVLRVLTGACAEIVGTSERRREYANDLLEPLLAPLNRIAYAPRDVDAGARRVDELNRFGPEVWSELFPAVEPAQRSRTFGEGFMEVGRQIVRDAGSSRISLDNLMSQKEIKRYITFLDGVIKLRLRAENQTKGAVEARREGVKKGFAVYPTQQQFVGRGQAIGGGEEQLPDVAFLAELAVTFGENLVRLFGAQMQYRHLLDAAVFIGRYERTRKIPPQATSGELYGLWALLEEHPEIPKDLAQARTRLQDRLNDNLIAFIKRRPLPEPHPRMATDFGEL